VLPHEDSGVCAVTEDDDIEDRDRCGGGQGQCLTGSQIKARAMEPALDAAVINFALAESDIGM
jgi:hypothetical protein